LPALRAVATGGDLGHVEQAVSLGADEFGAIPVEEGVRRATDAGGIGEQSQADRAASPLIDECPAKSDDQADQQAVRLEGH